MRQLLRDVDEQGAKRGLEIVRKECKLVNLKRVQDGIKMVGGVVEMAGVAKGLVGAGQWGEALNVMEELERIWEGPGEGEVNRGKGEFPLQGDKAKLMQNGNSKLSPLPTMIEEDEGEGGEKQRDQRKVMQDFRLSSLQAFSALPAHLRELTLEIAASLSSEIVGVLRLDLGERIAGKGEKEHTINQNLRDRLTPLLHGLLRTKGFKEATLSWREVVLGEIRGIIKAWVPGFDSDEGDDGSGLQNGKSEARPGLANHLRDMSHAEFMNLIRGIYKSLFNGIEGLQAQGHVFTDVLETVIKIHKPKSPPDMSTLQEDFADILGSAAELANTQVARVITFRAEQHAALNLAEFLAFFHDTWNFVIKCETICRRMIVGLRGAVVSQAKAFLQAFHQVRLTRSAKLVEDEQWSQTEATAVLQHVTETILDCAVRDSPELVIRAEDPLWTPPSSGTFPVGSSPSQLQLAQSNNTNGSSKHLYIEDRTYFIVSATAEVLVLLQDYLRFVVNLSLLTTDTMSRVIEFLKAFNSRTCQVVLGAGAMRSAGLKNITAKHLSLASQSLSIMFELIPYVRETFRRHLSPKQAVMLVEFDKLKRDFQEHQNEIHAKLIGIMGDRLNAHIKSLQSVDWNIPKAGNGVNEYMEILTRDTVMLHKVLTRYLSIPTVEYVMTQVLAAINHRLSEEYGKIDIPHQEAKTRLLADAKYLHEKFSALKHIGTPTSMLETVIAERRLPRGGDVSQPTSPRPDQLSQSQRKPLTRSSTMSNVSASANQRLRGLLSGRSPTVDKSLPPVRKEVSALPSHMLPRTASPGANPPFTVNVTDTHSASASVTSLLSIGGTSASASTLTLVESGGGASGVVLPQSQPTEVSGSSGTIDTSWEPKSESSDVPGFRRVGENGVKEEVESGPGVNTGNETGGTVPAAEKT
ncbi:hypothetical protein AX17_002920 [Amanita inopinata Kibby_2008]|nr:hypothetical protein AX17_002920 [Amanita inopinata Kibby_2008]